MSIESLTAELDAARRRVSHNNNKIKRLNQAKTQVSQTKQDLQSYSNRLRKKGTNSGTYGTWKGYTQQNFQEFISDSIIPEYQVLICAVDNRLDSICYEITALQNENYRLNGVIGNLLASINSLKNEIETSTN